MKSPGPWTMKTVSWSSIVLLAFFLGIHLGAATQEGDKPCCLYYSHHVIPWNWVHSYELAKGSCPQNLMVFTTKRGKFCVQPKAKWVQTYISLLEAQKHL